MAEYYPLLARAVAAQPNGAPEMRRGIYDRARKALLAQLRSHDPPIGEDDIERERRALEEAIAQIESEMKAKNGGLAGGLPADARPARPAPSAAAPRASGSDSAPPERRAAPTSAAQSRLAARAPRDSGASASQPASRVAAPRPPLVAPPIEAEQRPLARTEQAIPRSGMFRKFGRPGAGLADTGMITVPPPSDSADDPVPDSSQGGDRPRLAAANGSVDDGTMHTAPRSEPARPPAPVASEPKGRRVLGWTIGALAALVVVAVAILAFVLRENPRTLASHGAAHVARATKQAPSKLVARVGAAPAPAPAPLKPAAAPAAAPASGAPAPQNGPTSPAVPVAQRAAILVQSPTPNNPKSVATYVGTVVWRLDTVSPGPGQPVALAVRAQINVPDAKFKASMLLEKNADATLPASHTIEFRFTPEPGSPIGDIRQIDTPQMRAEGAPAGDPLSGIPAPITTNYFLVGLTKGGQEQARNIQLLQERAWFDVPLLLANGKIAKITFEKGVEGAKVLNEALASWSK